MIERLAWATAKDARGRDDDETIAGAALARAGLHVDVVDWDDADVAWADYDRVVLCSTWDYPQRLDDFLAWLDSVQDVTDVVNPAPMVRWNLDKHYLADLDRAGVPVIPTMFVERDGTASFPDGGFVVKPAVGAGSRDVASYGPHEHETATARTRPPPDRSRRHEPRWTSWWGASASRPTHGSTSSGSGTTTTRSSRWS